MTELWTTLLPLAAAGALVPIQIVLVVLLLRGGGGVLAAAAFVGGMTAVRIVQGLVFGLIVSGTEANGANGPGTIASVLLVALALLFYVTAGRTALTEEDPDAPPPKWMSMARSMSWPRAFAFGAGFLMIGAKFWVFTLSAIAAIEDAELSRGTSALTFIAFVALSQAVLLTIVGVGALAPKRSAAVLDAVSGWLERNNRSLVVVLGLVFGTWFGVKGLSGLGVI